jgi:hypothetical protein
MSTRHPTTAEVRTAAVEDLFIALDAVMHSYRSLPSSERGERMGADALLITGEIARRLAVARSRLSAGQTPLGRAS